MKSPKRFLMNVEAFWVDHDSKKELITVVVFNASYMEFLSK